MSPRVYVESTARRLGTGGGSSGDSSTPRYADAGPRPGGRVLAGGGCRTGRVRGRKRADGRPEGLRDDGRPLEAVLVEAGHLEAGLLEARGLARAAVETLAALPSVPSVSLVAFGHDPGPRGLRPSRGGHLGRRVGPGAARAHRTRRARPVRLPGGSSRRGGPRAARPAGLAPEGEGLGRSRQPLTYQDCNSRRALSRGGRGARSGTRDGPRHHDARTGVRARGGSPTQPPGHRHRR